MRVLVPALHVSPLDGGHRLEYRREVPEERRRSRPPAEPVWGPSLSPEVSACERNRAATMEDIADRLADVGSERWNTGVDVWSVGRAELVRDGPIWAPGGPCWRPAGRMRALANQGDALRSCGRGGDVWYQPGAGVVAVPFTCGLVVCPRCQRCRGADRSYGVAPGVAEAATAGGTPVFMTTTARSTARTGVVAWGPQDEGMPPGCRAAAPGEVAPAVPGESLEDALDRMRQHMDTATRGTGWREWYRDSVVGEHGAWEATIRDEVGGPLRWHVHLHRVLVLRPGYDAERWHKEWLARWCTVADARPGAQDFARIEPGDEERAARQVLKYACKLDGLTTAGIFEALTVLKGRQMARPAGAYQGSSAIATDLAKGRTDRFSAGALTCAHAMRESRRKQAAPSERVVVYMLGEWRALTIAHALSPLPGRTTVRIGRLPPGAGVEDGVVDVRKVPVGMLRRAVQTAPGTDQETRNPWGGRWTP